jgi:hypothetical protein
MQATGQSKATCGGPQSFLRSPNWEGRVKPDPSDRRARFFILNERGRKQTSRIEEAFEAKLLVLLGANLACSNRVKEFNWDLWCASGFLPPRDLANLQLYQRAEMPDDTRGFFPEPKRVGPLPDTNLNEIP